jgi:hypothetical protein
MTVSSNSRFSGPYTGNGVTTVFDYDFLIFDEDHISVVRSVGDVTSVLVIGSDYTVSGVGASDGGAVTLAAPLATGATLTINSSVPYVQETDLQNQGAYYAEVVEREFDLSVMRDQELRTSVNAALAGLASAVRVPVGENLAELSGIRAGKLLGFDASGQPQAVAAGGSVTTVDDILGATAIGRILMSVPDQLAAQTAVGALVTHAGAGAIPRTLNQYGSDFYSAEGFNTIAEAVAAAYAADKELYVPRTYTANTSIPNFHAVKKFGPGQIVANGVTWKISPAITTEVHLYFSPTGVDTNDGLSPSRPVTLDRACKILEIYAPSGVLSGLWYLHGAAGQIDRTTTLILPNIKCSGWIVIEGPPVPAPLEPTLIINANIPSLRAFTMSNSTWYLVRNIKIQNFTGEAGYAFNGMFGANIYTDNVHIDNCGYGVTSGLGATVLVKGGIIRRCTYSSIQVLGGSVLTVGYAAASAAPIAAVTMASGAGQTTGTCDTSQLASSMIAVGVGIPADTTITVSGPNITLSQATTAEWVSGSAVAFMWSNSGTVIVGHALSGTGVYVAENSMAHVDYSAIINHSYGVWAHNSRINLTQTSIQYNTYNVYKSGASENIKIGTGVSIKNALYQNYWNGAGGDLNINMLGPTGRAASPPVKLAYSSTALGAHTGTTVLTTVVNLFTLNQLHWFEGQEKVIRLKISGKFDATTVGSTTFWLRSGATNLVGQGIPAGAAANTYFKIEAELRATDSLSTQVGTMSVVVQSAASYRYTEAATALNFANSIPIDFGIQLGSASDSVIITTYDVYLEG